jgi:hypothetical protein
MMMGCTKKLVPSFWRLFNIRIENSCRARLTVIFQQKKGLCHNNRNREEIREARDVKLHVKQR